MAVKCRSLNHRYGSEHVFANWLSVWGARIRIAGNGREGDARLLSLCFDLSSVVTTR